VDKKKSQGTQPKKFVVLCGRIFPDSDPQYFPSAPYRGRKLRFCTDSCLGAFLADPDIFYKVHRNSEQHKNVETRG
jgi:hypothetical protein